MSVAARMVRRAADSHDQIARELELTVIVQYTGTVSHRHVPLLCVCTNLFHDDLETLILYTLASNGLVILVHFYRNLLRNRLLAVSVQILLAGFTMHAIAFRRRTQL